MAKTQTLDVHARELMQADVVRIDGEASLETAVETLEENGIGGAPVVDAADRLIGVFSLSDAARAGVESGKPIGERAGDDRLVDWGDEPLEAGTPIEEQILDKDDYSSASGSAGATVREWMNPAVHSVEPDASIKDVCSKMAQEHIHRVFVVEDDRLAGVISSLDVVEYLARAL